jgi:IclR family transcriptional regulator, KDG regulon repressor
MVKREKSNYMIQSVSHALDVLEELCKARGEVGVTELAKRLKLHKNNVFRLLATLELRGYVEQNIKTEGYRLGVKPLELGQSYRLQSTLVGRCTPIIEQLCDDLGETVSLAILRFGTIQFPVTIESKNPVRCCPREGVSFDAKTCAVGRLLIAQLPDIDIDEILAQQSSLENSIRSQIPELRNSLKLTDNGTIERDVMAMCQVIKDSTGNAVAAVEVLAPKYRANLDQIGAGIKEACDKIEKALGAVRSTLESRLEIEVERDEDKRQVTM